MIFGIGTDLTEVEKIKKAVENPRFLTRVFTDDEIKMFNIKRNNPQVIAGNFAVKESLAKALGTGFRGFGPADIEVLRDKLGKPYINLFNKAEQEVKNRNIQKIHVSISNTEQHAIAFVVCEI